MKYLGIEIKTDPELTEQEENDIRLCILLGWIGVISLIGTGIWSLYQL